MTTPDAIANTYIEIWNETDEGRRIDLIRQHWTADATYVDPLAKVTGPQEISTLIGGVQSRFPGFRFSLLGPPNGHGDYVRFSWSLGPPSQEAPIGGSDVVELAGGRLSRVIGFLDKVPAAA
jgi:hypothetical protein